MPEKDYITKEEGGKKYLVMDTRHWAFGTSIADYPKAMAKVINTLAIEDAEVVVLANVYERLYNEEQTKMLKELAMIAQKFESVKVWGYSRLGDPNCPIKADFTQRHDVVVSIAYELLRSDPILAYLRCLKAVDKEKARVKILPAEAQGCKPVYLSTLVYIQRMMETTTLIQKARPYLAKLEKMPTRRIYHSFFEAQIKPSFVGSRLLFGEIENLELVDQYMVEDTPIQIYKHPYKLEMLYYLNPPEYNLSPDKYFILTKTKEIVAKYRPGKSEIAAITTSRDYFERIYKSTIEDIAEESGIKLNEQEKNSLARLVARYTIGYGTLEILLKDRKITDIYVDAPLGTKPVYIVHSKYDQCQTNVVYTDSEADALISRFRAMSGRPFDEAHPVLDYDLPDVKSRLALIGPPLSPQGNAMVYRLHKETPWTLPQEIEAKMVSPLLAGALSFFIDAKASTIVTGSRGAGKTSLMHALMLEVPQNLRILVQEDTLETPVPYMKNVGFNIQWLKTRSAISVSATESEVSPEDSLRTALRLGDSVLIVGEVRSKEAKVLYEAMRIGAVGNVVMGTIHGENAYSVWDRVVNDLDVPTTSFKATDIVVTTAPVRFGGALKRYRRCLGITEIGKEWRDDPLREGGLIDLVGFSGKNDEHEFIKKNWENSVFLKKIEKLRGIDRATIWNEIDIRAKTKKWLVDTKQKYDIPLLLEAQNTVPCQNKLILLAEDQRQKFGSVDYTELYKEWETWAKEEKVKPLVQIKQKGGK